MTAINTERPTMYGFEAHKNRETGHKISAKLLLSNILALAGADALADGLFGEEPALGSPESRLTQAEKITMPLTYQVGVDRTG